MEIVARYQTTNGGVFELVIIGGEVFITFPRTDGNLRSLYNTKTSEHLCDLTHKLGLSFFWDQSKPKEKLFWRVGASSSLDALRELLGKHYREQKSA